ncbi:MAG: hypothetical protein WCY88_14195 [Spongiibacteraceae bacterium]
MKALITKLECILRSINHPLLLVGIMVLLVVGSASLTVFFADSRSIDLTGKQSLFDGRDFVRTPFGLMDAYDACVDKAKSSLGDSLLRNTMLPLSTRYEVRDKAYVVALDVDVGTIRNWDNAMIFCSVNPVMQRVTYYKEHYDTESSLLTRSISFIGKLIN